MPTNRYRFIPEGYDIRTLLTQKETTMNPGDIQINTTSDIRDFLAMYPIAVANLRATLFNTDQEIQKHDHELIYSGDDVARTVASIHATSHIKTLKEKLTHEQALLEVEIRESPFEGVKITDSYIEAKIKSDPTLHQLRMDIIQAEQEAKLADIPALVKENEEEELRSLVLTRNNIVVQIQQWQDMFEAVKQLVSLSVNDKLTADL